MSLDAVLQHTICGVRFQPIYSLEEKRIQAWEVLSLLTAGVSNEAFFISLSHHVCLRILHWQLCIVNELKTDARYFLNVPAKIFCHAGVMAEVLPMLHPGIVIEIQNPDSFISLSNKERRVFDATRQAIKATGAEVWLDDVVPEHFPALFADLFLFDGVKVDKTVLWHQQSIPKAFNAFVASCLSLSEQVLVEGVETIEHFKMAMESGCTLLQGYLWPEEKLNISYVLG